MHSNEKANRFTRVNGNKYLISAVNDVADEDHFDNGDGDDTFLDGIYKHLALNKNYNPLIPKLLEIISTEQYDTDSIDVDLDIFVEYCLCIRLQC